MSVMKSRKGKLVAVRSRLENVREGNRDVGTRVWATATVEITTDGPDKGRLVLIDMDPEEALTWSQKMIDAAGETLDRRDHFGHSA